MSFFSALTVPGLQQHLSFSREDSAILKGYGILFMIFHHVFGLYSLPASVDTAWIAPCLTKAAPIFKICVPIFIFITGYAMGWKTNSSSTLGSLVKTGFSHYLKFWKIYFLCLLLATLVSWAFPLPILPSVADMGWKNGLLAVTGLKPCYPDWWYMALFAAASIALYPTCAWITHHIAPVPSMTALLEVSLLLQSMTHIPCLPEIASSFPSFPSFPSFLPCFILGYMCAFLASRFSALSTSQRLGAILLLALEILSIHLFSFSKAKTLTVIFLFTLWCLPWITRKLRLTPLLTLLGTYSALMWLNHRFIFGYHFSWDLYGTRSISIVFIVTLASSLLLAIAMQKLFNRMIRPNPPAQSKTL